MLKEGLLALVLRGTRGVEVGSDALLSERVGVLCRKAFQASGRHVMPASSRGRARKQGKEAGPHGRMLVSRH
jgi:hypothetical protein